MVTLKRKQLKHNGDLSCACCQMEIPDHGSLCSYCGTPLEVSRGVRDRGTEARFVSVVGASGAGKTVYLGMLLDMLSKGIGSMRGLPNGPFSLGLQQQAISALVSRRFPEKTASESDSWNWVHCQVTNKKYKNRVLDMITPDVAGEAVALEVEQPDTYPVIRTVLARSEAILLLFDSLRCRDSGRTEDMFAMKMMSYLYQMYERLGQLKRGKVTTPVAIVFTKSDICPEVRENPRQFAESNMPGLTQSCESRFSTHEFFATALVGSHAFGVDAYGRRVQVPLHVEPRGVVEPMEWAFKQLH